MVHFADAVAYIEISVQTKNFARAKKVTAAAAACIHYRRLGLASARTHSLKRCL
jgi:hypothetical protein